MPPDCDDNASAIHPNAQELVGDGTDEDCDGLDALRRHLIVRTFPAAEWGWAGTVSEVGDSVKVGNVGSPMAWGSISRPFAVPMPRGKVHVALGVSANAQFGTAECRLVVSMQRMGTPSMATWTITGQGTGVLTTGDLGAPLPARGLTNLRVECDFGASVTIDWLSVQNTDDIMPPSSELGVTWSDLGLPGGGLMTSVVRSPDNVNLWAGSDVGGVAVRRAITAVVPWKVVTGDPVAGALESTPDLGVADVLETSWGEVFLLTGRWLAASSWNLQGGLFSSVDGAESWQRLAISDPPEDTLDGDVVTVAGYGKLGVCDDDDHWGGGALLAEEPDAEGVYIADHDAEDLGLAYWDGVEACLLATADLPPNPIGALARVETATGVAGLVVGFRGGTDGLYLCELPQSASVVSLDCLDTSGVTCWPVSEYLGVDVRDLEVDPTDASIVYVADGGDDASASTCTEGANGGVYSFKVYDDGSGGFLDPAVTNLTHGGDPGGLDLTWRYEATGVSMDPDGQFLLAFVPVGPGSPYDLDRIYRIAYDDLGTAAWVPFNGPAEDEEERDLNLDLQGAWLEASTRSKPRVSQEGFQSTLAPGAAFDGVWFSDTYQPDDCNGQMYSLALVTNVNMWRVDNADGGCDGAPWDPDSDTVWTFWPDPDEPNGLTWQTTSVRDIAWDPLNGDVWTAMGDLGLGLLPDGEENAEVDCLWNALSAGGQAVVVTQDGTVWATLWQENPGIPHRIAVLRSLQEFDGMGVEIGAGYTWEYESAAIASSDGIRSPQYAHYQDAGGNFDFLYCIDKVVSHKATAFGEEDDEDNGNAFVDDDHDTGFDEEDDTQPSWGQPVALDAVDSETALVGFASYDVGGQHTGRLAYTIDGGGSWETVTFDPTHDYAGAADCNEYAFYGGLNKVALLKPGLSSYNNGGEDWRLEFFVSSRNTVAPQDCALARVVVQPSDTEETGVAADWVWYPLDRDGETCPVDGRQLNGVVTSPWGKEAFIWGTYASWPPSGDRYGGVCAVDVEDPTNSSSVRTTIVSPQDWRFSIGAVEPHPYVSDLLAVAPIQSAISFAACHQDDDGDCPDAPRVLLVEHDNAGWSVTQLSSMAPHLAGNTLAWTDLYEGDLLYGTAGGGAWRGDIQWE